MPGVSEEQIKLAREVGLLSYLSEREPDELQPSGLNEFKTKTHSSLVVLRDRWYWNKGGFGGCSALDYLVKVRGMDFVAAVEAVLGVRTSLSFSSLPVESKKVQQSRRSVPCGERRRFFPPKPSKYSNLAVSYLQRRGISTEVISRAFQLGILFESRYYNPHSGYHNAAVCAFIGRNESEKIVFAALRGIDTDLKIEKSGSDKRYSFCVPSKIPNSRHLAVFESPIDALSHATLQQRGGWKWSGYRLSLGGTSSVALTAFLERNTQITRIMLHLDNDQAGLENARKIKAGLYSDSRFKQIRVSINPPRKGKDYNEALLQVIQQEQNPPNRRKADIFL